MKNINLRLCRMLCAGAFLILLSGQAAADYEKGVSLRAEGNYEEALNEWLATSDDPRCMTAIGSLYEYGEGVSKDEVKAAGWYAQAAEKGEYRAIAQLANFSLTGAGGVAQNPAEWRGRLEGIEGKDGYADYILASFYLEGHGGERDLEKAFAILNALVNEKGHTQLTDELTRAGSLLADLRAGVLDAVALINEIESGRASFDAKYKDRRITVKGALNSSERLNDYGRVISVGSSQASGGNILAVFYGGEQPPLKPGEQVKFSGVYVGELPFRLGDNAFIMLGCAEVSEDRLP